jgi:hypothetical protein
VHVAYLRLTAGRYPRDARLAQLIGELSMKSDHFSTLWARGDVADCTVGTMILAHPTLGKPNLDYQVWLQPESPDHRLEIYTANDDASRDALDLGGLQSLASRPRRGFGSHGSPGGHLSPSE